MVSNTTPTSKAASKNKRKFKKNAHDYVNYENEFKNDNKFKTELCMSYSTSGHCKYGNKCRFAHGKDELFDKSLAYPNYKQADCNSFYTFGFCNYGLRCHFRHDYRKFSGLERSWFSYNLLLLNSVGKSNRLEVFKSLKNSPRVSNYDSKSHLNQLYRIFLLKNNTFGIH
jgi:hypothetical protein